MNKHLLLAGIFLIGCVLIPADMMAQVVDPGCDPLDPACPIDGGLGLLIAAGIGLGAKKAYQKKSKKIEQ